MGAPIDVKYGLCGSFKVIFVNRNINITPSSKLVQCTPEGRFVVRYTDRFVILYLISTWLT